MSMPISPSKQSAGKTDAQYSPPGFGLPVTRFNDNKSPGTSSAVLIRLHFLQMRNSCVAILASNQTEKHALTDPCLYTKTW